jgi:hypothetical protein
VRITPCSGRGEKMFSKGVCGINNITLSHPYVHVSGKCVVNKILDSVCQDKDEHFARKMNSNENKQKFPGYKAYNTCLV